MKWLKVKEKREYNVLSLLIYKIFMDGSPEYLYDKYFLMSNVHMRATKFTVPEA